MNVMIASPGQAVDPTFDFLHVSHALIVMMFSATMTSANHSGPRADLFECIFGGFVMSKNNPSAVQESFRLQTAWPFIDGVGGAS